jgi:hypothetical protein
MENEGSFLARKACELLSTVAPGHQVEIVRGRLVSERARLQLAGTKTVKYAHLDPDPGAQLSLRLNPGDTLTQAKRLYRQPARVAGLLNLRASGWHIRPNFHFGFISRGLTWTRSRLDVDSYVNYWMERIETVGVIRREEWDKELGRLIDDGIFNPEDEAKFDRDFRQTSRTMATPRPGLVARRSWQLAQALELVSSTNFAIPCTKCWSLFKSRSQHPNAGSKHPQLYESGPVE